MHTSPRAPAPGSRRAPASRVGRRSRLLAGGGILLLSGASLYAAMCSPALQLPVIALALPCQVAAWCLIRSATARPAQLRLARILWSARRYFAAYAALTRIWKPPSPAETRRACRLAAQVGREPAVAPPAHPYRGAVLSDPGVPRRVGLLERILNDAVAASLEFIYLGNPYTFGRYRRGAWPARPPAPRQPSTFGGPPRYPSAPCSAPSASCSAPGGRKTATRSPR